MKLPNGWSAPRLEMFVEDTLGFKHIHAFDAQQGGNVAQCKVCGDFLPVDRETLRGHAKAHHQPGIEYARFDGVMPKLEVGQKISIRAGDYGFVPGQQCPVGMKWSVGGGGYVEIISETLSSVDAVWELQRMK